MSQDQASSSQNAPSTWTEPPWSGWIETTGDALLILEAARRGLIPRVTRRLVDSERKMITSGSVFVFDEDESGIKRWTDGFFWSPSRILGNFLLYRETEKRGAGHRSARAEREVQEEEIKTEAGQSLSRPKSEATRLGIDRQRERSLVGSLTNSYKFKPGGMMKKTFSLTIGGVAQHLISYYKVEDVEQGRLRSPSTLPELASLDISPEYLDKTHFRNPPKVEIGVDGIPRYRGEADEPDTSPMLTSPLLLPSPEDEPSSSKRAKRYDPYSSSAAPKRTRKSKNASRSQDSAGEEGSSPTYPTPIHQTASSYPDPASLSQTTNYSGYSYYPSYPHYSTYPPPTSSAYTPAPVSPIQHTPTPPPQPASPAIAYPGYHEPAQSTAPSSYPYYSSQHSYSSYSPQVWPQYSNYGHSSVHHSHSPDAHDSLGRKEDREEVDSAA
ncbi:Gti1/Pac2 family-domain-containing protein [Phanerochaete sordida]|uniref:Gti1/Pac2 family-domain-containing protein n=1 Tax=Phanerochaete sordida TaxID=48140 RepID=A0A9P3GJ89_9APHY|nr:Gti1/Pac2 family-domain-containing protein [Phanerochaete sordida]